MEAPSDSGSHVHVGSVVQVCFPSVRTAVLDSLNQQRLEGRLCDLSIQVQRQVFRAHRCVLAASSPYFHDQVLLKNVTTVSLPSVMDPVAFESVLSSAYTGQLSILRDDIVNYVTVASFLQMWHIVDKCTEILKRPRASAELGQGDSAPGASYPAASSRQQSPSSTDCLYVEREGSRKDRRTDALPPLATWRRPQQFPRCSRPRTSAHPADSQLVGPGGESDYSSCDEVWMTSSKAFSHDGRGGRQDYGHPSTRPQGELPGEGLRLRARPRQRDPPPGSDRLHGRERGRGEEGGIFEGESQEKKRNERWIDADEGIGEVESEKSVWSHRTGHSGDFSMTVPQSGEGQAEAKVNPDVSLKKEEREQPRGGGAPAGPLGPLSPSSTPSHRVPWQAGSWSQQGAKPQDRPEVDEDEEEEEEEVDFGRFADGAFGGDTYDEIEDGTGQVSQRPLLPASPDDSEFNLGGPEMDWPSSNMGQPGASNPPSNHHLSSSSAMFPPSLSPPTPHAGAPYRGKVHFCHCGKAYTLKSMRDRHVKMQHLNLRPFGCLVCAKTFKMKHHLTKHLKTHGGLRPYECRLCGKKVIWRDSFLRHQARCERLTASYSDITSACNNTGTSAEMDYGFEEGQGFLAEGGQVKVEETDFQGEVEAGVSGLLGGEVAGVDALDQDSG
ncbi:zinc finger and BTB domain-containing protein 22 [Osmerus mordax]|uniref:zinc finger and BTB domain-containing protein 22 n=1 Tax=Osmerus mordax TaxID=8014 RepID=UPI00350F7B72